MVEETIKIEFVGWVGKSNDIMDRLALRQLVIKLKAQTFMLSADEVMCDLSYQDSFIPSVRFVFIMSLVA